MNSRKAVDEWLEVLGRECTGHPWTLDSHGVGVFQCHDLELTIEVDGDHSPVGVYVDLQVTPPEKDRTWLLAVLRANHQSLRKGLGTLAIHPVSQRLAIGYVLPVSWLDRAAFAEVINGLLAQATDWRAYFQSTDFSSNQDERLPAYTNPQFI